ncbi:MAG: DinB family protein [Chloroflexota bacterium]
MAHQLVLELQFAREKWFSGHADLSNEDAKKQFGDANSIGWMVGHLAWFEQLTWIEISQGKTVSEMLHAFDWNNGASVPDLDEVLTAWEEVTAVSDEYLNQITEDDLGTTLYRGEYSMGNIGTMLRRQIWHYWYHLGEMQALRQVMEHKNQPPFIGPMSRSVTYGAD